MPNYIRGILYTSLAIIFLSPDTLLFRLLDISPWNVLFWRGLLVTINIGFYLKINRIPMFESLIKSGKWGYFIILFDTGSNIFFYSALNLTTAANTLIILSVVPIFSAILGQICLSERAKPSTWLAISVICPAVILLASGSQHEEGNLIGDFLALGAAISISMSLVSARRCGDLNMTPCVGLANLLTAFVALALITDPISVFNIDSYSLFLLISMGLCSTLAMTLLVIAPRYISAAEVSLFLPLETIIGSFLVWYFIDEAINTRTFIGGAIILATVFLYSWTSLCNVKFGLQKTAKLQ